VIFPEVAVTGREITGCDITGSDITGCDITGSYTFIGVFHFNSVFFVRRRYKYYS
jgi:hypothetical protein